MTLAQIHDKIDDGKDLTADDTVRLCAHLRALSDDELTLYFGASDASARKRANKMADAFEYGLPRVYRGRAFFWRPERV